MKKTQTKKVVRPKKTHRQPAAKRSVRRRARYLPALVISLFATFLWMQPYALGIINNARGVLAYATHMSAAGLLSSTNTQRGNNGAGALSLNSRLSAAAQAKANDMISKDYWSHVSPNGTQPWWFITNAGYQYLSAGENLAYGFMTSSDTVNGWMNSASHRANMLNNTFTEVGFGIANGENYVGKGPQTVVVAMYAKPQSAPAAPAPVTPAPPAQPQTKPSQTRTNPAPAPAPTPAPAQETEPAPEPEAEPQEEEVKEEPIAIADTETPPPTVVGSTKVSRIQLITGGNAIWSASFVVLAVLAASVLWVLHKGIRLRRYIVAGERFLAHHHIHLDLTVLAVIYLGFVLLATGGTIR